MEIHELWANVETWRGGKLERLRSAPSPHLGEGPIPLQESQPPPRASPGAVLGPAPHSRSLLPFTSSLPPPDTSFSRLPPGAAKFLRSGP